MICVWFVDAAQFVADDVSVFTRAYPVAG